MGNQNESEQIINKFLDLIIPINYNKILRKKSQHNFIEVAGYPDRENVVSNILAFFLNVNEEHNFGNLFVKSIINIYINKINRNTIDKKIFKSEFVMYTEPIREFYTDKGNRIDIVIHGNYTIVIENKIFAELYNDLDDYYNSIVNRFSKNTVDCVIDFIGIVLSPYELSIKNANFVNITYKELFNEILDNIGNYLLGIDDKWFLFFKELIRNIDFITEGKNMGINMEYNSILKNNKEVMNKFFELQEQDMNEKRELLIDIKDNVKNAEFYKYESQHGTYKSLYFTFDNINKVKIEVYIELNEIVIHIWQSNSNKSKLNEIYNSLKLDNELNVSDFSNDKNNNWWDGSFVIYRKDLTDNFNQSDFENMLSIIYNKIKVLN